jgi:oxygen-independent coproporphyrinogen-3 oxidase
MSFSVYVHIPFCRRKCAYCDLFSVTNLDKRPSFIDALEKEIHAYSKDDRLAGNKLDTIFFGGGTPSLMSPDEINRIINIIIGSFPLAPNAEVSMEINPDDLTGSMLEGYLTAGVNRFSVGVQSLSDDELKVLGRRHDATACYRAVELLQSHDVNFSVDLIYGIPDQSIDLWLQTLTNAIALAPRHVSMYCLTLEEGTRLHESIHSGAVSLPDDEVVRTMYLSAVAMLTESGFAQYEISNFAREGFECRHNLAYWTGKPYLGVGPSAASYIHPLRWKNVSDIDCYVTDVTMSGRAVAEIDKITTDVALREFVMLFLRLSKGLDLADYETRFGTDFLSAHRKILDRYHSHGLLDYDSGSVRLTPDGMFVSNEIISNLI